MISFAYFTNRLKKRISFFYPVLVFVIVVSSCNQKDVPIPKPKANKRIDIPSYGYKEYQLPKAVIEHSDLADIHITNRKGTGNEFWFDIVYPSYDAVLHCTYLLITKQSLPKVIEDNHLLVYSHVSMADGIRQQIYRNTVNNVAGVLYEIDGDVATPLQFYATDSISNFIRGSLYYENKNNPDQKIDIDLVEPITVVVQKDIQHLLETLRWETSKKK